MNRVNLLPAEVRRDQANTALVRRITVVGLALAALLAGLYGIRSWQIIGLRSELQDVNARRSTVEAEIATYAEVSAGEVAVASAHLVVSSLLRGEVSWSEQMLILSSTVPAGFTLSSVSGSVVGDPSLPIIGTLAWSATSGDLGASEVWLNRLAAQEGWANGWVGSFSGGPGGYTLSGSVDLTPAAITPRGGGPA